MKVTVVSNSPEDIVTLLEQHKIEVIQRGTPDVVISYGGDGSLLVAERKFQGVPKFPIRDTRFSPLCKKHSHENLIKEFLSGRLQKSNMIKLSASFHGKEILALNDIFIHNYNRLTAIRCQIAIDGEIYAKEAASDSLGIATPHGSTAYFKNITGTIFRVGIGIAFSHSREREEHIIISEDSKINITILRGPAIMVADNSSDIISVDSGDEITVCKSHQDSIVYGLKEFMCPDCRNLRHKRI